MNMALSDRLNQMLAEKGWRQKDLVRETGFDQPFIQLLLSGKRKKTSKVFDIAKILGVNPEWLATGNGEKFLGKRPVDEIPVLTQPQVIDNINKISDLTLENWQNWRSPYDTVGQGSFVIELDGVTQFKPLCPKFVTIDPTRDEHEGSKANLYLHEKTKTVVFKYHIQEGSQVYLKSLDHQIPPIIGRVIDEYKYLGKCVAFNF